MTPKQLLDHFVTQAAAAAALPDPICQSAISRMVKSGRIPPLRQLQWQQATDGVLKADTKILKKRKS